MALRALLIALLEGAMLLDAAAVDTGQNQLASLATQSAAINLVRTHAGFYVASLGVFGLHPTVLVDTGSGDFWISSKVAEAITNQPKGRSFHVAYGSGSASGTVQTADVSITDGLQANCEVGVATREDGPLETMDVDGVWGLAPGGGVQGLVQCLRNKNLLNSETVALSLRPDGGGSMTLGAEPSGLVHLSTVGDGQWMVPLLEVSVTHARTSVTSGSLLQSSCGAVMDSGSSGIHAPGAAVHEIAIELSAIEKGSAFLVRCESRDALKLRFRAEFGEVSVDIPAKLLVGNHVSDGLCELKLAESTSGQWVLGDSFFQRVKSVVFNYETRTVGIAGLEVRQTGHGAIATPPEMSTSDNLAVSVNEELPGAVAAVEASLPPVASASDESTLKSSDASGLKAAALSARRLAEATAGALDGFDGNTIEKSEQTPATSNAWSDMRDDVAGTVNELKGTDRAIAVPAVQGDPEAEEAYREAEKELQALNANGKSPTETEVASAGESKASAVADVTQTMQPSPVAVADASGPATSHSYHGSDWTLDNVAAKPTAETIVPTPKNTQATPLRADLPVSQKIVHVPASSHEDTTSSSYQAVSPMQGLPEISLPPASDVATSFHSSSSFVPSSQQVDSVLPQAPDVLASQAKPVGERQVDWSDILDRPGQNQLERDVDVDLTVDDVAPTKHTQPRLRAHLPQAFSVKRVPATETQEVHAEVPASSSLDDAVNDQLDAVFSRTQHAEVAPSPQAQEAQPMQQSSVSDSDLGKTPMQQSSTDDDSGYSDLGDMWKKAKSAARQLRTSAMRDSVSAENNAVDDSLTVVPTADASSVAPPSEDTARSDLTPPAILKAARGMTMGIVASADGLSDPADVSVGSVDSTLAHAARNELSPPASGMVGRTPGMDFGFSASTGSESFPVEATPQDIESSIPDKASEVPEPARLEQAAKAMDSSDDMPFSTPTVSARIPAGVDEAIVSDFLHNAGAQKDAEQQSAPTPEVLPPVLHAVPEVEAPPSVPAEVFHPATPEMTSAVVAPVVNTPPQETEASPPQEVEESIPDKVSDVPEPFRFEAAAQAMRHAFESDDGSSQSEPSQPMPIGVDEATVSNFLHSAGTQKEAKSQSKSTSEAFPATLPAAELPYASPVTEAAVEVEELAKLPTTQLTSKPAVPQALPDPDVRDVSKSDRWMHAWDYQVSETVSAPTSVPNSVSGDDVSVNHAPEESSDFNTLQGLLPNKVTVPSLEMASQVPSSQASVAAESPSEAPASHEPSVVADLGDFWGKTEYAAQAMSSQPLSNVDTPSSAKLSAPEYQSSEVHAYSLDVDAPSSSKPLVSEDQSSEIHSPSLDADAGAMRPTAPVVSDAINFAAAAEADVKAIDAPDTSVPVAANVDEWRAVQRMSHASGASPWYESDAPASTAIPDHYSDGLAWARGLTSGTGHSQALNEATSQTTIASWRPSESQAKSPHFHTIDDAQVEARGWLQQFRKKHLSLLALGARSYRSSSVLAKVRKHQ
jgi:hypothetical protein